MEQPASLVLVDAVSKAGKPYRYISVQWNGVEIERCFKSELEIYTIFGGGENNGLHGRSDG